MPPGGPPSDEQSIRAELQKQGIDNFGQLVSAAARHIREQGDVEAERWYVLVGDAMVFIIKDW
jgi:hypothetical protein